MEGDKNAEPTAMKNTSTEENNTLISGGGRDVDTTLADGAEEGGGGGGEHAEMDAGTNDVEDVDERGAVDMETGENDIGTGEKSSEDRIDGPGRDFSVENNSKSEGAQDLSQDSFHSLSNCDEDEMDMSDTTKQLVVATGNDTPPEAVPVFNNGESIRETVSCLGSGECAVNAIISNNVSSLGHRGDGSSDDLIINDDDFRNENNEKANSVHLKIEGCDDVSEDEFESCKDSTIPCASAVDCGARLNTCMHDGDQHQNVENKVNESIDIGHESLEIDAIERANNSSDYPCDKTVNSEDLLKNRIHSTEYFDQVETPVESREPRESYNIDTEVCGAGDSVEIAKDNAEKDGNSDLDCKLYDVHGNTAIDKMTSNNSNSVDDCNGNDESIGDMNTNKETGGKPLNVDVNDDHPTTSDGAQSIRNEHAQESGSIQVPTPMAITPVRILSETSRTDSETGDENSENNINMTILKTKLGGLSLSPNSSTPEDEDDDQCQRSDSYKSFIAAVNANTDVDDITNRDFEIAAAEFDFASVVPRCKGTVISAKERTQEDALTLLNQIINDETDPCLRPDYDSEGPVVRTLSSADDNTEEDTEGENLTLHNSAATLNEGVLVGLTKSNNVSFHFRQGLTDHISNEGGGKEYCTAERQQGSRQYLENIENRIVDGDTVSWSQHYPHNSIENVIQPDNNYAEHQGAMAEKCGDGVDYTPRKEMTHPEGEVNVTPGNAPSKMDRNCVATGGPDTRMSVGDWFLGTDLNTVTDSQWKEYEEANVIPVRKESRTLAEATELREVLPTIENVKSKDSATVEYKDQPSLSAIEQHICINDDFLPTVASTNQDPEDSIPQEMSYISRDGSTHVIGSICPCNSEVDSSISKSVRRQTSHLTGLDGIRSILEATDHLFPKKECTAGRPVSAFRSIDRRSRAGKECSSSGTRLNKNVTSRENPVRGRDLGLKDKAKPLLPNIHTKKTQSNGSNASSPIVPVLKRKTPSAGKRTSGNNLHGKGIANEEIGRTGRAFQKTKHDRSFIAVSPDKRSSSKLLQKYSTAVKETAHFSAADNPGDVTTICNTNPILGELKGATYNSGDINTNKVRQQQLYADVIRQCSNKSTSSLSETSSSACTLSSYVQDTECLRLEKQQSRSGALQIEVLKDEAPRARPERKLPFPENTYLSPLRRPKLESAKLYTPKKHLNPKFSTADEYHKYKMDLRLSQSLVKIKKGPPTVDCYLDPRLKSKKERSRSQSQKRFQGSNVFIMENVNSCSVMMNRNKNSIKEKQKLAVAVNNGDKLL